MIAVGVIFVLHNTLRACCVHARHRARSLSSPALETEKFFIIGEDKKFLQIRNEV